jgi:hypothetical protein
VAFIGQAMNYILTSIPADNGYTQYGVLFGSGTTEPTVDDYCLESPLINGLSVSKSSLTEKLGDSEDLFYITYTITNTSDADVAISEMGVFGSVYYGSKSTQGHPVLMDRTVLSQPITIQPNCAGTVTYKVTLKHE